MRVLETFMFRCCFSCLDGRGLLRNRHGSDGAPPRGGTAVEAEGLGFRV